MQTDATISPLAWGRTLSRRPVLASDDDGWRTGLVRRWTGTDAAMSQPRLDHHYVVLHLGGRKTVERRTADRTETFDVPDGSLTIVPRGTSFEWRTTGPIDFAHLYLHPRRLAQAVARVFDREPSRVALTAGVGLVDPLLAQLVLAMLAEVERPSPWRIAYLDTLFDAAVVHLARRHSTLAKDDPVSRHALAPARLRRVLDHIDATLARPISLAELAAVAQLSRFHFSRTFGVAVGEPPFVYIARRRVELARRLLKAGDLPLGEVARRSGFSSPAYFATAFKRHTGVQPSLYRRDAEPSRPAP